MASGRTVSALIRGVSGCISAGRACCCAGAASCAARRAVESSAASARASAVVAVVRDGESCVGLRSSCGAIRACGVLAATRCMASCPPPATCGTDRKMISGPGPGAAPGAVLSATTKAAASPICSETDTPAANVQLAASGLATGARGRGLTANLSDVTSAALPSLLRPRQQSGPLSGPELLVPGALAIPVDTICQAHLH